MPPKVLVNKSSENANWEFDAERNKAELKKIESLCREFGVPDPDELYVIPRDFNSDNPNVTMFDTKMPDGMARWIDEPEFEFTISKINSLLAQADKIDGRTVWNGICNYATCFMFKACRRSRMDRAIIKVRNFVLHQNQDVYHPKGFHIVEPAARGMRHIEFRSITYYSMKYFLEHEDEIQVNQSEANVSSTEDQRYVKRPSRVENQQRRPNTTK